MKRIKKWIPISALACMVLIIAFSFLNTTGLAAESTMILKRNTDQNLGGAFSGYNRNGYNTTESMLLLNGQWAFCMEPSVNLNNLGTAGTVFYLLENGDGVKWLQQRYGWDFEKTNNLSKAICYARNYYGSDWICNYALVQNLIWSEIKDYESYENAARYMLTNTAKYYCGHLDSKEKLDAAVSDIWQKVYGYNQKPSFDGKVFQMTAGEKLWLGDENGVSDQLEFINIPDGVQVFAEKNGLTVNTSSAMAGKSITLNYKKNGLPASGGVFVYGEGNRQKVALWNHAINPAYGSVRIEFKRTEYLRTKYKARDQISPAFDIHIEKTDADTGVYLEGAEFDVYKDNQKMATVKTDKNGQASYHWRGDIMYTDYFSCERKVASFAEWKNAYQSARTEVLNKVENAVSKMRSETTHTWKVVETKAPEGYELNQQVWEQTFDLNTHAVKVDFTDTSNGSLKMKKVPQDTSVINDNLCYTLEGAEYGVFSSEQDAIQDTRRIATLKTDVEGNTETITLPAGTYYVKEITASKGYQLCHENDGEQVINGIHRVTVSANETATFTCKETPGYHSFPMVLTKMDADIAAPAVTQGDTSLEGAVFELSYYMNTEENTGKAPVRSWYFRTDENGKISFADETYLMREPYVLHDGTRLESDEYIRNDAGKIVYPIGSYRIREVAAPLHFKLEGQMNFAGQEDKASVTDGIVVMIQQKTNGTEPDVFIQNGETVEQLEVSNLQVEAFDQAEKGSITLYKRGTDGQKKPLAGVVFKMEGVQTGGIYDGTTDENGKIEWQDLIAQKYKIREIKTADGYNLLQEEIEVTLPKEVSLEELKENGIDMTQAVYDEAAGMYCLYNLTYTIDNTAVFNMPVTGKTNRWIYLLMISGCLIVAGGIWLFFDKKAKRKEM